MSKKRKRKYKFKKLYKRLFKKARVIVIKEDSLEEKFSMSFNAMKLFVFLTISGITIIALTSILIAFTPLREYIPGYSSTQLKKSAIALAIKSDSLDTAIRENNQYIDAIKKVLRNEYEFAYQSRDSILAAGTLNASDFNLAPTKSELELREYVDQEDKYNLFEKASYLDRTVLFSPAKGTLVKAFDIKEKMHGVLINLGVNKTVKSISKGSVIFSNWTIENGHVVIIRHKEGLLSIYKGLQTTTKSEGDFVLTGEVVGMVGDSSSNKSQLLFELWKDGYPIDSVGLIDFEE